MHDISIQIVRNEAGEIGFKVYVGGGQGRTPMITKLVREFLPEEDLLAYSEAILRVYNRYGHRDNKYKARIKILVHKTGIETLRGDIKAKFKKIRHCLLKLPDEEVRRIESYFTPPTFADAPATSSRLVAKRADNPAFDT